MSSIFSCKGKKVNQITLRALNEGEKESLTDLAD